MAARPRHQQDLFEIQEVPPSIPISVQGQMLEFLETLLTEAISSDLIEAQDTLEEVDHDEDHA